MSERSDGEGDEGEEDDGQAPVETEPMEIEIDELALTEAELAAKKAEKERLQVRCLRPPAPMTARLTSRPLSARSFAEEGAGFRRRRHGRRPNSGGNHFDTSTRRDPSAVLRPWA